MKNKEKKDDMDEKDFNEENEDQFENKEAEMNLDNNEIERAENEISSKKIEELEKEIQELKDKFLRKAAEFENYKRRTENDQLNLIKYAAESFIIKLLPIVDDFERSLQHLDNAKDADSIKKGISLVYDKLMKILEEQGVKKIDSIGKPFDVHYHEALMQRKDKDVEPHTVLDEIEKGYIYKDRVIRHAKVIVSEDLTEEDSSNINEIKNNSDEE